MVIRGLPAASCGPRGRCVRSSLIRAAGFWLAVTGAGECRRDSMTTRCQLRFVRDLAVGRTADPDDPIAQVYIHSDGYPEGVLERLHQLERLLTATSTVRGPTYAAAQYLFIDTLASLSLYLDPGRDEERRVTATTPAEVCDPHRMEGLTQPLFLLGHGVEDPTSGIHGDEEYLYVVAVPPSAIDQRESRPWRVAVSERCGFPRWDAATGTAFSEATWQFEGTLSDARARFDV